MYGYKKFLVEVIRKSNGKVVDRIEFDTYEEVLAHYHTINTRIYRTAVIS